MATRKKAVSIRMNAGDIRNVKRLADRLQVRDSDVIRFAVKSALLRLAPLCEEGVRGRGLVPVLMEASVELFRHFELDLARLEMIVNGDVDEAEARVDREDLRMIAMHGMHRSYSTSVMPMTASPDEGTAVRSDFDPGSFEVALKRYLYDKYMGRSGRTAATNLGSNG